MKMAVSNLLSRLRIFQCSLFYLLMTLELSSSSFPKDQVPKSRAVLVGKTIYSGNISASTIIKDSLYVGSEDILHVFNIRNNFEIQHNISWPPDEEDTRFCKLVKQEEECHNFITVIEPNNERLLVCGTNANSPSCKYFNDSSLTHSDKLNGLYKAPFTAGQKNQAIYAGGDLYAGTVSDSMGSKSVIARTANDGSTLVTEESDSKWLNEPDFISSYHIGGEVFFFLRETAVEYNNVGKSRFSRVARVCTMDKGGSDHVLEDRWTTYLKARIVCSIPGEYPFYFNEIQDTVEINGKFYGVFTTPNNSIQGSAICTYDLSSITDVFNEGQFKEQQSAQHAWLPVPENQVPEPRPGSCQNDSTTLSYNVLLFAKSHTLMHDVVEPSENSGLPLFTITRESYRFSQIVVDKVTIGSQSYDVMFIGTDNGKILKVVMMTIDGSLQSNLIDEMIVVDPEPIVSMEFVGDNSDKSILVGSPSRIVQIGVQRCEELEECGCVQDPYCGWNDDDKKCEVFANNVNSLKQNITAREECPIKEVTTCECPECPTEFPTTPTTTTTTNTTSSSNNSSECRSTPDVTAVPSTRVTTLKVEEQTTKAGSQSPQNTADNNLPLSAPIPTDRQEEPTDNSNEIPNIVPGRTETVVGVESNCNALTWIAIIGWILLALLGIILIVYFCCKRARNSKNICYRTSGKMDVSQRQEQVMKTPDPPQQISYVESENAKNNQQDSTTEKPSKPPVPPKPKSYDQSSLTRPPSNHRDSYKDVNKELKYSFIHSNGGSSLNFPLRGEKVAQV